MGRRCIAGDGESADAAAWRAVRIPAGRLRGGVPARGRLLLFCVPALGLAPHVLHWRTAGAARALRSRAREGIRSLAAHASRELVGTRACDREQLEVVRVPG